MENMTTSQDAMKAARQRLKTISDRLRLRRSAGQLDVCDEERCAERARIAQELHDTLLQGFISASMQLHAVVERLPADSAAKAPLNRVLQLMGNVIEEGRNV